VKLAMSAIAWEPPDDHAAAAILREHGFEGVELAPTKIFSRPDAAADAEVSACRGRGKVAACASSRCRRCCSAGPS